MNKSAGALLLSMAILLAISPLGNAAFAAKPQVGNGTFSGQLAGWSYSMAGLNVIAQTSYQMTDTGALSGTCTGSARMVGHMIGMFAAIHGTCSFSGSVQVGGSTLTGTAHVTIEAKGGMTGGLSGKFVLIGDSGTGLAGVQVVGPASGTWLTSGAFSGSFNMQSP